MSLTTEYMLKWRALIRCPEVLKWYLSFEDNNGTTNRDERVRRLLADVRKLDLSKNKLKGEWFHLHVSVSC